MYPGGQFGLRSLALAASVAIALCTPALGQSDTDHTAHHPGAAGDKNQGATQQAAPAESSRAPAGGMMDGMMMGPPRKEFYPSLMDLPPLSNDRRATIENDARTRIRGGLQGITEGAAAYTRAYATGNMASASDHARDMRRSLDELTSGAATLQGLAEGKPPQQLALSWFRGQLGLSEDDPIAFQPFGVSPFHFALMLVFGIFAITMFSLYHARVRSVTGLAEQLARAPVRQPDSADGPPVLPAARAVVHKDPPRQPAPSNGLWRGDMRVTAIFQETSNVKTFRFAEEQGGAIPFSFLPGQYLTFAAEIEGKMMRRSYTIASSPNQTGFLEATIKREEDGVFSRYMHDRIAIGDKVHVTAPSGAFTFRGKEADSVVLIGGGVGITPLMSAIRYLTDEAWPGEIYLVYGAKTTRDFIFRDELEYLQRRHTNLHVSATMMRAEGTSWMGPEGAITKEFLAQSVPELKRRRCHVCGPPAMMTAVKQALAELGVPKEQIRSEAFGTAKGALPPPGVTEIVGASGSANLRVSTGTATPTISFAQSAKSAPLPADKTVLEVAESIGVPIDFQCRAGTCGICKTKLLEGKVTMEVEDALTPEDKAQNMILACQAKSIGNLVVDA